MKEAEVLAEIDSLVTGSIDAGETVQADWVAHQIMLDHPYIQGDDAPFYRLGASSWVRDCVRRYLHRFKPRAEVEADKQLVLEGFERLQRAYLVTRNKQQVIVPVDHLSVDELRAKGRECQAMGDGCYQHASELFRYASSRQAAI
ncbi:MAG: hypothetical protein ACPGVG_19485 [Mycobacterium sp.]